MVKYIYIYIYGKVDKSDTYNEYSGNISFFFNRTSSELLLRKKKYFS